MEVEGLQIGLGTALTVVVVVGGWLFGITWWAANLQAEMKKLRHIGELLTFMQTAGVTLTNIDRTMQRFERLFEKHEADDKAAFQKLNGSLAPIEEGVRTLKHDVERVQIRLDQRANA